MRLIVASGPWGTDSGGWEGFEEICRLAQTERPDILILVTTLETVLTLDGSIH